MKWNLTSKRFFLMLVVVAVWITTLATKEELFMQFTPYAIGLIASYMGFESWKPTGE